MKMKEKAKYPLPIREWSEDDRPREKLLKYGEQILSKAIKIASKDRKVALDRKRDWLERNLV